MGIEDAQRPLPLLACRLPRRSAPTDVRRMMGYRSLPTFVVSDKVTDRDRVIVEIGPPRASRSSMSEALLLNAYRQSWITPPISVGRGLPARKPVMKIDELLSNLQRDRADATSE
jgi:hypothetical protein